MIKRQKKRKYLNFTRTTSIDRIRRLHISAIIAAAPEAIVVSLITDRIRSVTIAVHETNIRDTEAVLALLPGLTVSVLNTLAPVVRHVADGGGVGTVTVHVTSFKIFEFSF